MLEACGLHKIYNHTAKAVHVLNDVSLSVAEGDMISIVGPSGAGKSTLLHVLGGLDKPTDGAVLLDGKEIYSLTDRQRAEMRNRDIGFIFQFYHLLPEFTALENVIMPVLIKDTMRMSDAAKEKGLSLLRRIGLGNRVDHRPGQLSGGEQQRVAIARALINDPRIILCDEPTGNLDSKSGEEIIALLKQLNSEYKQTVVVVTHDEKIAAISKRKIHMRDGHLLKR